MLADMSLEGSLPADISDAGAGTSSKGAPSLKSVGIGSGLVGDLGVGPGAGGLGGAGVPQGHPGAPGHPGFMPPHQQPAGFGGMDARAHHAGGMGQAQAAPSSSFSSGLGSGYGLWGSNPIGGSIWSTGGSASGAGVGDANPSLRASPPS